MRRTRPGLVAPALLALGVLSVLLAAAPTSQAAINGPRPYAVQYDYMPELDGPLFTMVSGEVSAVLPAARGTFGFIGTQGAELSGLDRVCWVQVTRQCADSSTRQLSLVVRQGGSFGLRLPDSAEASLEADHGLAMFADLEGTANLNSLQLGKSLLAPLVGGRVVLSGLPSIPASATNHPEGTGAGALAPTEDATTIEVRQGGSLLATLRGKGDTILFSGQPVLAPVACDLAVLPFLGAPDVARFSRAGKAAAREGLDIARINGLMDRLYSANEGAPTQSSPLKPDAFGPYADAAAALFAGAVLRLPTQEAVGSEIAFARVTQLQVRGTPGGGLAWDGRATFEIRDGHVTDDRDLVGFGVFQLPWWSWVLWLAALGVWITRLVRKPEKTNDQWDPYKWVGWVASPLLFLLVFWLWDLETRAVLGLSLFSGDAGGQVLFFVALLQVGTFFLASFAAIAPLRMLFRNGSLLFHQGTFMGLSGAAASLLGFLFIATYLRSYLDVFISQVLAGIA